MKVIDIVLRGGAEVRRIVSDEACQVFLDEIETLVGAVPLDAAGKKKKRRLSATRRVLLRQSDATGNNFYVDPEEIAAITVADFELKDF